MPEITQEHINRLIEIESSVQYDASPAEGEKPFLVKDRESSILISAPHGAKTYRNNKKEVWHEEDEYTAGMAMLLGEVGDISVIAMVSKSKDYDPNHHEEGKAEYKQTIREVVEKDKVAYVIDLHGAALNSARLAESQLVDLGLGKENDHLPDAQRKKLIELFETQIKAKATDRKGKPGFAATGNTIAQFCRNLNVRSVQIEMKPQVRVAHRFPTASLYTSCGQYDANPNDVMHMLQAMTDFIEYLKEEKE